MIKNESGDTSICFSIDQGKAILKKLNKLQYLDSITNIQEKEISSLKVSLKITETIITEKNTQLANKDKIIEANEEKSKLDKLELKSLQKTITREKIKKWVAITAGSITTGFMTYLWWVK